MNINDMLEVDGTPNLHLQSEEIRSDTEALEREHEDLLKQQKTLQKQRQQIMDMYS